MTPSPRLRHIAARGSLLRGWARTSANRGVPGADGVTIDAFAERLEQELERLREDLLTGSYAPGPLRVLDIPKPTGGARRLRIPSVRDRVAQGAALDVLRPTLEAELEACSFAYLPGLSYLDAIEAVRQARDQGFRYVVDADIERFFDSVDHGVLAARLAELLPEADVRDLLLAWVAAPEQPPEGGHPQPRHRGLPQGAVIAPLLANLVLDRLDEALLAAGYRVVRYADDFVVLCTSRRASEVALDLTEEVLQELALRLHPTKTRLVHMDDGFRFLGRTFVRSLDIPSAHAIPLGLPALEPAPGLADGPRPVRPENVRPAAGSAAPEPGDAMAEAPFEDPEPAPPAEALRSAGEPSTRSLFVTTQGAWLRRDGGRLQVTVPGADGRTTALDVPLEPVQQVFLFGRVSLSASLRESWLRRGVLVHLLTDAGEPLGVLSGTGAPPPGRLRAQLAAADDPARRLAVARALVTAKVANARTLLQRNGQGAQVEEAVRLLERMRRKADAAGTLDELRGCEGAAAAAFFRAFGTLLHADGFTFTTRRRRPPPDPVNALLSLAYTMLYRDAQRAIQQAGLHPEVGFLHAEHPGHAALASDLVEPYRSHAEGAVLALLNRGAFTPEHVEVPEAEGAPCRLTREGLHRLIKAVEEMWNSSVTHPALGRRLPLRRCLDADADALALALAENAPFRPFRRR